MQNPLLVSQSNTQKLPPFTPPSRRTDDRSAGESGLAAALRVNLPAVLTGSGIILATLAGLAAFVIWLAHADAPAAGWSRFAGATIAAAALAAGVLVAALIAAVRHASGRLQRIGAVAQAAVAGEGPTATAGDDIVQLGRAVGRLAERAEREARRRQREWDRFMTVLGAMNDGVILLDRQGVVSTINPAAARLLQVEMAAAQRKSFVQLVRDYRLADVWQQCRSTDQEQGASVEVNPGFFLRINVTPYPQGSTTGYLVLLQDVSQVYRIEAIRRDFISNVSHELRTPLASIKALVETLSDGAIDDPPAAERFLRRVEVEVDQMTQMVQELLELSRIESGQAPLRLFPCAVNTLVDPAVERLRAQAERARLTLTVVLPDDLPPVLVDADRIRQVIINLVHNAVKFTAPGGYITVSARAVREGVIIAVADTGIGIPAADQARIFERFYKADRARAGGGTGLGLAIAKHTIQAHNGRIWVESAEGRGSTFSFLVPLVTLPLTHP